MNKRCTNSECRKRFSTRNNVTGVCPYCGKKYRQLNTNMYKTKECDPAIKIILKKIHISRSAALEVLGLLQGKNKVLAIKLVRTEANLGLREAKDAIDNVIEAIAQL